jgi:sugar lactone lactonase YvrE
VALAAKLLNADILRILPNLITCPNGERNATLSRTSPFPRETGFTNLQRSTIQARGGIMRALTLWAAMMVMVGTSFLIVRSSIADDSNLATEIARSQHDVADTAYQWVRNIGSHGRDNGQFITPAGIALDSAGNIWVADFNNNRIQKFSGSGSYLQQFGNNGRGQTDHPAGVAIDSSGNVWVADTLKCRIVQFDSSGSYLWQIGTYGREIGQLINPHALAVDLSGNVWVADSGNNRIVKYNKTGQVVAIVGGLELGSDNGQFYSPQGIAMDHSGNVWVADTGNNRLQKFDSSGTYLTKIGTLGSGDGQFHSPQGLTIDSSGNIWVVDSSNNRIQKFDNDGNYIGKFGTSGSEDGQLSYPGAVALDSSGIVWVSDRNNNRIEAFSPCSTPPPTSLASSPACPPALGGNGSGGREANCSPCSITVKSSHRSILLQRPRRRGCCICGLKQFIELRLSECHSHEKGIQM